MKIYYHIKNFKLRVLAVILSLLFSNIFSQTDSIIINEFMALNQTALTDEDGEYSDWIELYNISTEVVYLEGWSLTDDFNDLRKWEFPDIALAQNEYIIIFASGKDRNNPDGKLHTNFKLSGAGEFLALVNTSGITVSAFDPFFPEQQTDISYGFDENSYVFFSVPTPGAPNDTSESGILPKPVLQQNHGFYYSPFSLEITVSTDSTEIYYTTDGSLPDDINGSLYTSPLVIDSTSVIRAIAIKNGEEYSGVITQTYIFPDDIIRQPNNPPGYPSEWGPYTAISGTAIADYEMDQELIGNPAYADSVKSALLDLPSISIVTDKDYLFSHDIDSVTGGIYIYTGPPDPPAEAYGYGWERPASMEYFNAAGTISLQVNCGVRLHGGHSRRPEKSPKHSFRLVFKDEYGPSKLNYPFFGEDGASGFDNIVLRAGFGNSWIHHSHDERARSQYLRDTWAKDTQREMGHPSSHVSYVHLYINGIYWGVYSPSERMDRRFAASYLGGNDDDYDVIKDYTEVVDGEITAWNTAMTMANNGLENNETYQCLQGKNPDGSKNPEYESMVDVVNLIDYMLINFYGGNTDWDHHNWAAMRNRVDPDKGFKFFCWDEEHILKDLGHNVTGENNNGCPSRLFQQLRQNEDFRLLFADRVQKYCYNNGLLTPESAANRWTERRDIIQSSLVAEAARWGDYRRDVHQYQTLGPFDVYTVEDYWLPQQDFILGTYFSQRTEVFLNQLRNASLFPSVNAPLLMINDQPITQKIITPGDILTMSSDQGIIYYTTSGSDPALKGAEQENQKILWVSESAEKRVLVPSSELSIDWYTEADYDDTDWMVCSGSPGGIGYDTDTDYDDLISLDVEDTMYETGSNPNTTCYIRIPFSLTEEELSEMATLYLNITFDDGFMAYLNGEKIAEYNSPGSLYWNSAAWTTHEADEPLSFNISSRTELLKTGENLLAIHGLNADITSSDFLINVELEAGKQSGTAPISAEAVLYTGPVTMNSSAHVKARTFYNGEWSAASDQYFMMPSDYQDVKITEIHYHPLDEDTISNGEFEFIEIKNTGVSTLDLGGLRFNEGITYTFPPETDLASQEFIVLASDEYHFYCRYGFAPFDEFGGQLSNDGELIVLTGVFSDTLCFIEYNDAGGWPETPDGDGNSLVPVELNPTNDQNSAEFWRASYYAGGSPGEDDLLISPVTAELLPDTEFTLHQNYPNPFSEITYILYELPVDAQVELSVYNIIGQHMVTLISEQQYSGKYQAAWDGTDKYGQPVNSGIYIYQLQVKNKNTVSLQTKKMLFLD